MLIIANRGGWGNVPLERCADILPVIQGITSYLDSCGIRSALVPYQRAPADSPAVVPPLPVQLATIAEMLDFHHTRVRRFAARIDTLLAQHPQLRVIFVGVSNGAVFTNQVMEALWLKHAHRLMSIELGAPFWHGRFRTKNSLIDNNDENDPLTSGRLEIVFASLFPGVARFIGGWLKGKNQRVEEVWHIPDHDYPWERVGPRIREFLHQRLVAEQRCNP